MTKYESDYLEFASENFLWRELDQSYYERLAGHGLKRPISNDGLLDILLRFYDAGKDGRLSAKQIMAYIQDFRPYEPAGVDVDRYIQNVCNGVPQ